MDKRTVILKSAAFLSGITAFLLPAASAAVAQELTDAEMIAASQGGASPLAYTVDREEVPLIVPGEYSSDLECTVRSGLPNFFGKISDGEDVTVAFIGGSITQGDWCYRLQTSRFMEERWPGVSFRWINAGVSGTGTDLGAFRIDEQVLAYSPDLVFIEFAVNGAYAPGMEGMVRKIIKADPHADICFLYTIKNGQTAEYQKGSVPENIQRLEQVAGHYGIPSIHLGMEAAQLEKDGRLLWKGSKKNAGDRILFSNDGIHPLKEGGNLYAAAVARGLLKMQSVAASMPHELPEKPLYGTEWDSACMYAPADIAGYDGNWKP